MDCPVSLTYVPTRRSDLVDVTCSGIYHCISRCVRREPLLANPRRRALLITRTEFLTQHAAIDVISFAVLPNHLHLLLRTRPELVRSWSDEEVATRRAALLPNKRKRGRMRILTDAEKSAVEIQTILNNPKLLQRAREELSSLGFFHRLLKEPCARLWNREDDVTGHFWEGRFKSPRILDRRALMDVSTYIDLNEIHACLAHSLPSSVFTSARVQWLRLCDALSTLPKSDGVESKIDAFDAVKLLAWNPVFPCRASENATIEGGPATESREGLDDELPTLIEYINHVDHVGRRLRHDKPGVIDRSVPSAMHQALTSLRVSIQLDESVTLEVRKRLERWWRETVRPVEDNALSSPINESSYFMFDMSRGSCYGGTQAVAVEAQRRGRERLVSISIGA